MKTFYQRYKHAIPLLAYAVVYCCWFAYLEKTVKRPENLIHMRVDDAIPFCEIFVIPYFLPMFPSLFSISFLRTNSAISEPAPSCSRE